MAITPDTKSAALGKARQALAERDKELAALRDTVRHLQAENKWLRESIDLAKTKLYSASSEATKSQMDSLFNEIEAEVVFDAPEPVLEEITYRRKKTKGKRDAQLADLPVEEVHYELPESERVCAGCSGPMHEIGTEDRRELIIVPARASVRLHMRHKYGCRHCQCHGTGAPVVTAIMPAPAFPGSLASPSAVAFLMSQKYELGLPLYRLERYLAGLGIYVSRQTMANWMIAGAQWLYAVYDRMHELLVARDVLHADETTLQVLHEAGRPPTSKSYMWLYRSSGREESAIVLYDYQPSRVAAHPKAFLAGFKGYLHVDGCASYNELPNTVLVGCWAHARRKFDEALRVLPPGARESGATVARQGLNFCNRLFKIESELSRAEPEQRHLVRQEQSAAVLDSFHAWLVAQNLQLLPKSLTGEAVRYCLNQWPKLTAYLRDGRLELDNNRSERAIKPFVIGRKNWLFCNTPRGARASATIYSIVETAKENGLRPAAYLEYLLEQMPLVDKTDRDAIDQLMPWAETVQRLCK